MILFILLVVDFVCHCSHGRIPTMTRSIVTNIPWWIAMPFFTAVWIHFALWYLGKSKT
jgi:hypothetical protein